MTTITVNSIQLKRSRTPGVLPASLKDGEEFVNFADGFRIIGDGVTPPSALQRIPYVAAAASDLLGVAQDTLTALGGKLDTNGDASGTSVTPTGGLASAILSDLFARSVDIRNFGPVTLGKAVTSAQIAANTAAVDAAIVRAKQIGASGIVLPPGDLVLTKSAAAPTSYERPGVYVQGANSFYVIGQNTTIWSDGTDRNSFHGAIGFSSCTGRCGIAGTITVDVLNPSSAQGTVVAINGTSSVDVLLDWAPTFGDVQRANRQLANGMADFVVNSSAGSNAAGYSLTQVSGLTYRLSLSGTGSTDISHLAVGDRMTLTHQIYGGLAVWGYGNDLIDIGDSVLIAGSHGMGVNMVDSPTIGTVRIRPGKHNGIRKILATEADGTNFLGSGGTNVLIDSHCTGDDAVNFGSYDAPVAGQTDTTHITVGRSTPECPWRVGDSALILDGTHAVQATATISAVSDTGSGPVALTFATPVPSSMTTAWSLVNATSGGRYELRAGSRVSRARGALLRTSATDFHVGSVSVDRSNAVMFVQTFNGQEFGSFNIGVFDRITATRVNNLPGSTISDTSIVKILPTTDGTTPIARGGQGRLLIGAMDVIDTNAGIFNAQGLDLLKVGAMSVEGAGAVNASASFATLADINRAEFNNVSRSGGSGAITATDVGTLRMRNAPQIVAPSSGVTTLDVLGTQTYTPTLSSGSTVTTSGAPSGTYRVYDDGMVFFDLVVTVGSQPGSGYLNVSPPVPIKGGGLVVGNDRYNGNRFTADPSAQFNVLSVGLTSGTGYPVVAGSIIHLSGWYQS
jgi:hypothetical protein